MPTTLRARASEADAVLFVTPEYNRSAPATLKNVIDVGSRPPVSNVWARKPGAVISVSPGALGGFGANHHLRQSLMAVNVLVMAQPEAYIGGVKELFDADGHLARDSTRELLRKFLRSFESQIDAYGKSRD